VIEARDHACHKGLTDVVELLLMKGAEVDGSGAWSPLYLACRRGHIAVAKLQIGKGATVKPEFYGALNLSSSLHAAYEGGYPDVAKLLLDNGADVNRDDFRLVKPLHQACTVNPYRNEMNTVTSSPSEYALIALSYQDEVAVGACSTERVALVALLLAENADMKMVDGVYPPMSPLSLACRHGLVGVVELLISHGVDVNLVVGMSGKTSLSIASTLDQVAVAQLLLASEADVNHQDSDGRTPQHEACERGQLAMAQLLLASGADVAKACEKGKTPLHLACQNGHTEVASLLVATGANVSCPDVYGNTPLHTACNTGHSEVATFLLAAGASVSCTNKFS
jgi:ankyrin repeat domain-containing protein 17